MAELSPPASAVSSQTQSHCQPRPRPAVRYRAAKACRRCNEKRVKCDASERGTPCSRCEGRNEPDCTLIESRRGMYVRKPRQQSRAFSPSNTKSGSGVADDQAQSNSARPAEARGNTAPLPSPPSPELQQHHQVPVEHHSTFNTSPTPRASSSVAARDERSPADWEGGHRDRSEGRMSTDPERGPTLPAASSVPPAHDTPSGNTEASSASSYREISWAAMFDHLFEGQHKGDDVVDKGSITYLGESFPLAIVLKDLKGGGGRPRLHHPGPPCPPSDELSEPQNLHHPPYMGPEEIAFLEAKKAFETPGKETVNALIDVFLSRVFPIYPIVNPQEFLQQHSSGRIPWILLHALCFISATFCPGSILHRAGFESRRQARWSFYCKAKALFDVAYEGNKIVVLQVAILMSFWGGGPNNYWNFYSWISTGVTIAEALGCHRSMAGANIKPQDRSLLKRLWWILVVRDTACAALVGRPFRVNLDHCDTDPLTAEDFQYDAASPSFMTGTHAQCSGLYQIHVTKLTLILRQIIVARFYPLRDRLPQLLPLSQMLTEWRAQLPPQLQWSDNAARYSNVFASTLCVLYNHHIILAHLPCPLDAVPAGSAEGFSKEPSTEEISTGAAQQIASTACAVATKSDMLLAPHELLHGIFIAAVIFYMQTKSPKPMMTQLGTSGLANCQMLLHESRESWDPSPWITQLFDKVICTEHPSQRLDPGENNLQNVATFVEGAAGPGAYDENAMFLASYDMWQSHLVLGTLFDNPQNGSLVPMTPGFDERPVPTAWFDA